MKHKEEYKKRLISFQRYILTFQLIIMVIGGSVFSLAVMSRPVIRITKPEFIPEVKRIVNVMVGASLIQIVAACYDIFSGCWRMIWPLYLGIGGTSLTVLLELGAVGSSLYFYTNSMEMVNEEVVHPWYWVECLKFKSCHDRMLTYIHWFILPQVVLAIITVIIQCVTILLLGRLVKTIAERKRFLGETQERYRDEYEEKKNNEAWRGEHFMPEKNSIETTAADSTDDMKTPKRVQFFDQTQGSARKRGSSSGSGKRENIQMVHTTTYEAQIHAVVEVPATPQTPCSIVTEDHGYIQGSRVSLDIDKP